MSGAMAVFVTFFEERGSAVTVEQILHLRQRPRPHGLEEMFPDLFDDASGQLAASVCGVPCEGVVNVKGRCRSVQRLDFIEIRFFAFSASADHF